MNTSEAGEARVWTPPQKSRSHRLRIPGDRPGPRAPELYWWSPFAENLPYVGLEAKEFTASPQALQGRFYCDPHSKENTEEM